MNRYEKYLKMLDRQVKQEVMNNTETIRYQESQLNPEFLTIGAVIPFHDKTTLFMVQTGKPMRPKDFSDILRKIELELMRVAEQTV